MVKRRFNNLRTEIANNSRSIPPKKSLYDLRERAKKIIETAKNTGGTAYKFQRKITVETTVQKGIRNFVKLKCECGYSSGDYSMPPGSNYAFCHSIKSNGLSKTKINNFISI